MAVILRSTASPRRRAVPAPDTRGAGRRRRPGRRRHSAQVTRLGLGDHHPLGRRERFGARRRAATTGAQRRARRSPPSASCHVNAVAVATALPAGPVASMHVPRRSAASSCLRHGMSDVRSRRSGPRLLIASPMTSAAGRTASRTTGRRSTRLRRGPPARSRARDADLQRVMWARTTT